MKFVVVIIFSVLLSGQCYAECLLNCMFQAGTKCVDGKCVPVSMPTSSDIYLRLEKGGSKAVEIDCSKMDTTKIRVFLTRTLPPPAVYYYSDILFFDITATGALNAEHFFARKDMLNQYVFLYLYPGETPEPQAYGIDFVFNKWENAAFSEFFAVKTCTELKNSGLYFNCGISIKGDRSDYESATFTFK